MIPTSRARVPAHTDPRVNKEIRNVLQAQVVRFADMGPRELERHLKRLDREWDIERMLQANASVVIGTGLLFSQVHSRRWLILCAAAAGFLLQHAVQGWCPPLPFLRRLGFRTPQEIDEERYALKVVRGDFDEMRPGDSSYIYQAVTQNTPAPYTRDT